ncbi:unnamed protein product [Rotaria sordida]|uniref:Uncharacterized protein n=2 Tax=Rotaria sordida TaxID=392033 RepID=A0A815SII7_9BILA|nr:unnamed protein product [Rotaria sordida]
MEKQVDLAFYSQKLTVSVTTDPTMTYFQAALNAVMIYPDPVHGDLSWYMKFMETLKTTNIDWLELSEYSMNDQKQIEDFPLNTVDNESLINLHIKLANLSP